MDFEGGVSLGVVEETLELAGLWQIDLQVLYNFVKDSFHGG